MSTNSRRDDSWILLVLFVIAGVIAAVIWQFSTFFGLDMATGATVLFWLGCVAFVTFLVWKFLEYSPFSIGNVWPILLAMTWACCWPALDYRASQDTYAFMFDNGTVWWDAWYFEYGVAVAIIGICYLFKKLLDND